MPEQATDAAVVYRLSLADPAGHVFRTTCRIEAPDPAGRTPEAQLQASEALRRLEDTVYELPARQREAFMLRTFEGLDVAGTAVAMGCSEGSVKTHYSRAVHTLREKLGDHW